MLTTYHLPHLPPSTYHLPPTIYHLPPTTYQLLFTKAREYVLRCLAARPQSGATPTAQRMYVGLRGGQWRLALALSLDQDFGDGAFD